jgi:ribonuclease HII
MNFLFHPSFLGVGGFEEEGYSRGFKCIAGLDEVGRGPLAGPVLAGAVVLPRGVTHPDINDSKLLRSKKREELAAWIKQNALAWGVGVVDSEKIDRMNILRASLLAMAYAVRQLDLIPDYLLIDGPHKIPLDFLGNVQKVQDVQNDLNDFKRVELVPFQRAIKKGDQLCLSIAAASIVAKVTRDHMMMEYDRLYPEYGFGQNKGYGSPSHLAALDRYGPTPIHRRSFKPVRQYLAESPDPLSLFLSPSKGEREG